jgi:hypothetical protein
MKLLVDDVLLVIWVAAYLATTYGIACYRRARAHTSGGFERNEYRAEKDAGLRVIVCLVGALLGVGAYFASRAFS